MKKVNLQLAGLNGNAFSLMGAFAKQAGREGWSHDEINQVLNEAQQGDYDHLLRTLDSRCEQRNEVEDD